MLPDIVSELLPELDNPAECLRRAETCEQMAREAEGENERAKFLKLAGHWREMAEELETKFGHSRQR
jgi:hypothetical protein